jgi:hypothetical protein
MAWRDWLRRRAAADVPSGASPDRSAPGDPGSSVPGDPGPSVPGGWDGGWRRAAPPDLTVSRAPLGVSDGLVFRAGLAAWQNPSFDSGLGHALLPAAPTGLVRGVTGAAAPRPLHTAGGPLLLRALRPQGADGSAASGPHSSAVRPSRSGSDDNGAAGEERSDGDAPRTRGLTSSDSPAVLSPPVPAVQRAAQQPGTGAVVAPAGTDRRPAVPRTPLVRRVAVVPPVTADRAAAQTRSGTPEQNSGRMYGPSPRSGSRTPADPAVRRAARETTEPRSPGGGGQSEASRPSGADVYRPAVRPSPVGPRLTVARRPAGSVRRVAAVRTAVTAASDTATTPDASGTTAPAGTSGGFTAPVQRTATHAPSRAPLGPPLSELPPTATPSAQETSVPGAGSAAGPALPVVQRQADTPGPYDGPASGTKGTTTGVPRRTSAPDPSGARARGGLGAPLSALPPSAELPGSAAYRASRTTPGPDVQRVPVRPDKGSTAVPVRPDKGSTAVPVRPDKGSTAVPVRPDQSSTAAPAPPDGAAPLAPGAGAAPLLGTADVQRSLADHSATGGTTETGPADHASGPATPLVIPPAAVTHRPEPAGAAGAEGAAGNARRPGTAPGGAGAAGASAGGSRVGGPGSGGSRADGPTSGGPHTDGPGSGRQRPQRPAAPGPVVVARAMARGAGGARPSGSADPRPVTVTRSAAHPATAAPRTLSLLAARPLTLSTRAPEGAVPSAAVRSGNRPVVAARWPGAPAAAQGAPAPTAGVPGGPPHSAPTGGSSVRPASHLSAPAPTAGVPGGPPYTAPTAGSSARPASHPSAAAPPQARRPAPGRAHSAPSDAGVRTTGSPAPLQRATVERATVERAPVERAPVQRVPAVRPAPPRPPAAGASAAVPARPLPVTAPQAPPLADRPRADRAPAVPAPVGPVPVVRPRTAPPGSGPTAGSETPVQRNVTGTTGAGLLRSVPAKEAPARGRPRSSSGPAAPSPSSASSASSPAAPGKAAARRPETPQDDPGLDLDDLARRLLDPVSRLLRTELRRGRERTGRPYDGRR